MAGETPTPTVIRGVVLNDIEKPVSSALVYLLPKGVRGLHDAQSVPHAGTAADGGWQIQPTTSPKGQWVCAIADGYFPAYVDGDEIDPSDNIVIRLRLGPRLVVHLRGLEESSHLMTTIRIEGVPERDSYPIPGPYAKPTVLIVEDMSGASDRAIPVGTDGPIVVRARRWGCIASPEKVELQHPGVQVDFDFSPSCILQVRVVDDATDKPVVDEIRAELLDKDGEMYAAAIVTNPNGMLEFSNAIPPGRYGLRVSSSGRETLLLPVVPLTESGRREVLVARLKPAVASGFLIRWASDTAPPGLGVPTVYARPVESPEQWQPSRVLPVEGGGCRVPGFKQGRYDFLLVHPSSGKVAQIRGKWIDPDAEDVPTWVEWSIGCFVDLGKISGRDRRLKTIRCLSPDFGALPKIMAVPGLEQFWTAEQVPTPDARLGPYPCPVFARFLVEGEAREEETKIGIPEGSPK